MEFIDVDRLLSGFGDKEFAFDADVVAKIKEFVDFVSVFAELVFAEIGLDFVFSIAQVGKTCLAHVPVGNDSTSEGNWVSRFERCEDLICRERFLPFFDSIGVEAELAHAGQLFQSNFAYRFFVTHSGFESKVYYKRVKVNFMVLCDHATTQMNGSPILVGIFRGIHTHSLPGKIAPFYLAIELEAEPHEAGEHRFDLNMVDQDGNEFFHDLLFGQFNRRPDLAPSYVYAATMIHVERPIEKAGPYRFDLLWNGEMLHQLRIDIG